MEYLRTDGYGRSPWEGPPPLSPLLLFPWQLSLTVAEAETSPTTLSQEEKECYKQINSKRGKYWPGKNANDVAINHGAAKHVSKV